MPARFYRRGMSISGMINNAADYVGSKLLLLGCIAIAVMLFLLALALFATWFAVLVFLISIPILCTLAKAFFYHPIHVLLESGDDTTNLEYVKEVQATGNSEITIHSQPGYGTDTETYVVLELVNSMTVSDCRNITSIHDRDWRDIEVRYFHPVKGPHKIKISSAYGKANSKILEMTPDYCRVLFTEPIPPEVRIEVAKLTPVKRHES